MSRPTTIRRAAGFTLVELLVVIGIIALLIGILMPALNRARQQSVTVQCLSQMRQIGQATIMYTQDFNGFLPGPCTTGQHAYYDNTSTTSVYLCTFLAHYLGLPFPWQVNQATLSPCFVCPAFPFTPDQTEKHITLILQPYLPIEDWSNVNAPALLPFGQSVTTGVPVATPPARLVQIKESATAVELREIDAKNTLTHNNAGIYSTATTSGWPSGWNVLGYPMHGMKGRASIRNVLYFDGHAETIIAFP